MRTLAFLKLFNLFIFIKFSDGSFDGMVSCAIGSSKKSDVIFYETIARATKIKGYSLESDVKFLLYTKELPYSFQVFLHDQERLKAGNFDVKKETKILIHGYRSGDKKNAIVIPRNAFLESGDFNILVVDWSEAQYWGINHALPLSYPAVVKKLKDVAKYVTSMIRFLENFGMNLNTTTIVGHSLGAHVAGVASYNLKNKVNRIVGLDPAGPYFTNKGPGERLSKEAATFVEVIHSEITQCGLKAQLGHYDFYPNSGLNQPGCDTYKCSHSRSYRYFAESIVSQVGFHARRCADWTSMEQGKCDGESVLMGGLQRKPIPEGIYYVKTNDQSPFALGAL